MQLSETCLFNTWLAYRVGETVQQVGHLPCIKQAPNSIPKGRPKTKINTIVIEKRTFFWATTYLSFMTRSITSSYKICSPLSFARVKQELEFNLLRGWSNSTADRAFSLHIADLGLIAGIPYVPLSTARS